MKLTKRQKAFLNSLILTGSTGGRNYSLFAIRVLENGYITGSELSTLKSLGYKE